MDNTTPRAAFTNANRHISEEEELVLTSVGVDIGSSTSHLVFSRLELERQDGRYITVKRDVLISRIFCLPRTKARRRSTAPRWAPSSIASATPRSSRATRSTPAP